MSIGKFQTSLRSLAIAATSALLFCGCSTLRSKPVTVIQEVLPSLPENLLTECQPFRPAPSSDLSDVLSTHNWNMLLAGQCLSRHNALVKLLRSMGATP